MNIFRFHKPIFASILMFLLLCVLPGFKTEELETEFPAPFENPGILLYHNFAISGIYENNTTSEEALAEISCEMKSHYAEKDSENAGIESAEQFLKEKILDGNFKPEELYFYFSNSQTFALVVKGSFLVNRLEESFANEKIKMYEGGIFTTFSGSGKLQNTALSMIIKPDYLLICPDQIFQETLSRVEDGKCYLEDRFSAFKKMLRGRPAIASEIDLEKLSQELSVAAIRTPDQFKFLKYVRLMADDKLTKVQFSIPDDNFRKVFSDDLAANLHLFNAFLGENASFSTCLKGRSLYLETDAKIELERKISRKFAGFIFHFLEKNSEKKTFAAANIETGNSKNDQ